jgi:hypothetical protein
MESSPSSGIEAYESYDDASVRVILDLPKSPFEDWLDLHVSFERRPFKQVEFFATASIDPKYIPDNVTTREQNCYHFDLQDLAPGEEVILHNSADLNEHGRGDTEMSVIFTYQRMNPIMLKCSWHGKAN